MNPLQNPFSVHSRSVITVKLHCVQRITVRKRVSFSDEHGGDLEDVEMSESAEIADDDDGNTNGTEPEVDSERKTEDEMDGDKVVENVTKSVTEIVAEEDAEDLKESDDPTDGLKPSKLSNGTESEQLQNEDSKSPEMDSKNIKIAPYESVEEYLFSHDDGAQKRRASLRSANRQKIRISPRGDQQWHIMFAESHVSTSDKVQIRKLIETAFDRSCFVRGAMSGNGQDPLKFVIIKNEKDQIVSFLSYVEMKRSFLFLMKHCVTMREYKGNGLGAMCVLALQYRLKRKGLDLNHRLYAEIEVDAKDFWEQKELNMVDVEEHDKRLSIIGSKVKQDQDLCEYIWIGDGDEAEVKLLGYLNAFHFKVPVSA